MDNLNQTVIGKDVIESLTLGMYEDARIIYREYIQNSADQIDKAVKQGILDSIVDGNIWIDIDKTNRQIIIEDNATGIAKKNAVSILKNIAQSTKQRGIDKGFRGIGRLGGLAYCDKLIFETSYKGEDCKTIIEWDAKLLKFIINNRHNKESASEVIDKITYVSFFSEKSEKHYFKVTLLNVSNDDLLDVAEIRNYLSMVAPTKIHPKFTLLSKIKENINSHGFDYDTYNISVNSNEIYKDYTSSIYEFVGNDKRKIDEIKDIVFFKQNALDGELLFWGWYGVWSFSKQIPEKANPARGLRLRKNNIQIGDEYCLVKLHKEARGNFYYFGEIHAVHPELIPNARRDYFLENSYLKEFENYLVDYFKELYSSYYLSSKVRSSLRDISKLDEINAQIKEKEQQGYKSHQEKDTLLKTLREHEEKAEKAKKELVKIAENAKGHEVKERVINTLINLDNLNSISKPIGTKPNTPESPKPESDKPKIIFIDDNSLPRQSKEERKLIKRVFDVVDSCLVDKVLVESIRFKIIEEFNKVKS